MSNTTYVNPEISNTTCVKPEISNTTCVKPEISNTTGVKHKLSNTRGVKHERRYGINIAKGTTDPRLWVLDDDHRKYEFIIHFFGIEYKSIVLFDAHIYLLYSGLLCDMFSRKRFPVHKTKTCCFTKLPHNTNFMLEQFLFLGRVQTLKHGIHLHVKSIKHQMSVGLKRILELWQFHLRNGRQDESSSTFYSQQWVIQKRERMFTRVLGKKV